MRRLLILFLLFILSLSAFSQQKSEYILPFAPASIVSGDLDLDGDLDIVTGHKTAWENTNPTITILLNESYGEYLVTDTSISFSGYQENMNLVDLNQNGYLDLTTLHADFSTGEPVRFLRVFYNENGIIESFIDFPLNHIKPMNGLKYGDVNNDETIDIILASNQGSSWGVMYNDSNYIFSLPEYHYVNNTAPTDIDCGDLDGDGRDDILLSGNKTLIFYSDTSGFTLDSLSEISLGSEIVDFDLDGNNDIIIFSPLGSADTYFYYYKNISNRSFALIHTDTLFNSTINNMLISDFDNNGYPDIAVLTIGNYTIPASQSGLYIFYNQDGIYTTEPQFIQIKNIGEISRNFHIGDFDGNGYNDIAIARLLYVSDIGYLKLLFNDGNNNFVESPQTSIPNLLKDEQYLTCYPNPFKDQITFHIKNIKTNKIQLQIHNLTGQLLTTIDKSILTYGQIEMYCPKFQYWPEGFYFASLLIDNEVIQTIKIIKTK